MHVSGAVSRIDARKQRRKDGKLTEAPFCLSDLSSEVAPQSPEVHEVVDLSDPSHKALERLCVRLDRDPLTRRARFARGRVGGLLGGRSGCREGLVKSRSELMDEVLLSDVVARLTKR